MDLPETDCEAKAGGTPEFRGDVARLKAWGLSSRRLGDRERGRKEPARGGPCGDCGGGLLSRRSLPNGERDLLLV